MVLLVPASLISHSPSRSDGISERREAALRSYGAELVLHAGILLRLPHSTCMSGTAILQRFYFRKSLAEFEIHIVAQASLLLACKYEETHRRLKAVVMAFQKLRLHDRHRTIRLSIDLADRQKVVRAERCILKELGFAIALILEHPHKYVLQFVNALQRSTTLAQRAWNYLNDSARTALCCMYQPHVIACASIYLAARSLGVRLPQDPPWWVAFDAQLDDLVNISELIMQVYVKRARGLIVPRSLKRSDSEAPCAEPHTLLRSPSDDERNRLPATGDSGVQFEHFDVGLDSARITEILAEQSSADLAQVPVIDGVNSSGGLSVKRKVVHITLPSRTVSQKLGSSR